LKGKHEFVFGNLGGGSPFANIAANPAERSAEMSLFLPNITYKIANFAKISANKSYPQNLLLDSDLRGSARLAKNGIISNYE